MWKTKFYQIISEMKKNWNKVGINLLTFSIIDLIFSLTSLNPKIPCIPPILSRVKKRKKLFQRKCFN